MTIFTVHQKREDDPDTVELVPDGFSFWAFAFTFLWAAMKGLWLVAVLMAAAMVLLALAAQALGLGETPASLLQLAVSLLFGFEASTLRRWTLARRGYREVATVSGATREVAELAFFANGPARSSLPPPPPPSAARPYVPGDALGLFGNV